MPNPALHTTRFRISARCTSPLLLLALYGVLTPATAATEPAPGAADPFAECLSAGKAEEVARSDAMYAVIPFQPGQDADLIEARVAELESRLGVRDEQLFPELMALGLARKEGGAHAQAANAFRRAMFIVRANDGLYSPDQIPVLELLIESRVAAGQWKPVADAWDLLLWVHRRVYRRDDPRLLPVLTRLRRWHIEAYNKDDGRALEQHYAMAEELYDEALQILEQCVGERRRALCYFHSGCCADAPDGAYCPADRPHRSSAGLQSD